MQAVVSVLCVCVCVRVTQLQVTTLHALVLKMFSCVPWKKNIAILSHVFQLMHKTQTVEFVYSR